MPTTAPADPRATEHWQARAGRESAAVYPVHIVERIIADVPVHDITPVDVVPLHPGSVIINLHGGGFRHDSGSLTESIPVANLAHTRVVAVLYRLAPAYPYPAALEDAMAAYRELLKTYAPAMSLSSGRPPARRSRRSWRSA